jgi:hypothetical protein
MANPARARNLAAAVVTAAVVSILVGAALPYAGKGFTPRFLFLMGGLVGITFGGVLLGIFWDATRRYARLTAGQGVIARWTIDPAHWERFRQLSKAWDQGKGVRRNNANLDQKPGPQGIEIVVTGDSLLLGNAFYPFEANVSVNALTERIEFHETIYKRYGPPLHIVLRIPLAPGGQHDGALIAQVYSQAKAAAAAKPFNKFWFLLLFFGGLAALTGLISLVMHLLNPGP